MSFELKCIRKGDLYKFVRDEVVFGYTPATQCAKGGVLFHN